MLKKILIIDEDREAVKLKGGIFKFLRFDVELASNFDVALEKAKKGGVDIVLSDIPMSETSGDGFVDMMKDDISTKNIPIIMLASSNLRSEKRRLKAKGISDYIVKPFDVEKLIKRVNDLIDNPIFYSSN